MCILQDKANYYMHAYVLVRNMALWCKITTYTHPVPSPNVGSESSSSGIIGGVVGAVSLLVGICICTTIIGILIRKGLKQSRRGGEVAHNRSNPTRRARLPVRTGPQTIVGVTAPPPYAASQDMQLPLLGGMEEEEVVDSSNGSNADHGSGVNPIPVETDDEQPLLPN